MNVIVHKRKRPDDGIISFPPLQCWNPTTKVATIAAQVSGKRVSCRISAKDLKTKFDVYTDEPMKTVTEYRKEIESAARRLIEDKAYEEDGSISVRFKDL